MNAVKLGDICNFYNGGAWSQNEFTEAGYPVLKVSNCKSNGFEISDVSYIPYDIAQKSKINKLQIDDVIIATVGSHPNLVESAAGRSCVVTTAVVGFYLNQNAVCLRSKDPNVFSQKYLGYLAASAPFKYYIQSRGKGAANQMRIAISAIKDFSLVLPDIEVQKAVGTILSAYDDLIENNQKQIKLLEEAAQRLYKEWFVDLRFPGHENTKITDGIPEGWRRGALADVATFKRGKTITKEQTNPGVVPVVAGGLEPAYFHDTFNTGAPVITVSGSGANAGFTRMYHTKVWASDCSYVDSVATENLAWVYCFLKENNTKIETMQKGAAQPHVYAKDINALEAVIPNDKQMKRFQAITEPMFARIGTLETQKARLREACNCLLPKLMNGEIEV